MNSLIQVFVLVVVVEGGGGRVGFVLGFFGGEGGVVRFLCCFHFSVE